MRNLAIMSIVFGLGFFFIMMFLLFPGLAIFALAIMVVFGTLGWIYEGSKPKYHTPNSPDSFDSSMKRKDYHNRN